jgi:hypothetical protein
MGRLLGKFENIGLLQLQARESGAPASEISAEIYPKFRVEIRRVPAAKPGLGLASAIGTGYEWRM